MGSLIETPDIHLAETDHHAFNRSVWGAISADTELAELNFRIETNKFGQLVMSPPPSPSHGKKQFGIGSLIEDLTSGGGEVLTECPISTSDGIKAADIAWCSDEVWETAKDENCFFECPELCVEVLSPSNTKSEIKEKQKLYFEAGAKEVWICDLEGKMTFYTNEENALEKSNMLPDPPQNV